MSSSPDTVFTKISEIHIVINRAYSSIFEVGFLGLFKKPDYAKAALEVNLAREKIISLEKSGNYGLKTKGWLITADYYCHLSIRMLEKLVGKGMGIKYPMSDYSRDLDHLVSARLSELEIYELLLSEFMDLSMNNAVNDRGASSRPSLSNAGLSDISSKSTPQGKTGSFSGIVNNPNKIYTGNPNPMGVKNTTSPPKQAPTHTQSAKTRCYLCHHEYYSFGTVSRCNLCGYLNRSGATEAEIHSFLLSEKQ